MSKATGRNISLIFGISIPIIMILVVASSIYLPQFFAKPPQYNFAFTIVSENFHVSGLVTRIEDGEKKFFCVYDVSKGKCRTISSEEVQGLKLDKGVRSPDGYEVVHGRDQCRGIFYLFGPMDREMDPMYFKGPSMSKKIKFDDIRGVESRYAHWKFLGWILKEEQ